MIETLNWGVIAAWKAWGGGMTLLNSVCLLLKALKSSEAQACLIYCICHI